MELKKLKSVYGYHLSVLLHTTSVLKYLIDSILPLYAAHNIADLNSCPTTLISAPFSMSNSADSSNFDMRASINAEFWDLETTLMSAPCSISSFIKVSGPETLKRYFQRISFF